VSLTLKNYKIKKDFSSLDYGNGDCVPDMLEPLRIPGLGNNTWICSGAFNRKNACFFMHFFCSLRARQRTHMKMLMGGGACTVQYNTKQVFSIQAQKVNVNLY
jgi:hypothetical protein